MGKYVIKRILLIIPILLGVSFIIYWVMAHTPSDPASIILSGNVTQEQIDALNHELGYDQPVLVQYFNFVKNVFLPFDFGNSYRTGKPVIQEIMLRFPTTVKLAVSSMVLSALIGISLGVLSAVKQYSILDTCLTIICMLSAAIPAFWLGMLLILKFGLELGWLPVMGVDTWTGYILPSVTLSLVSGAGIMRLMRTTMLETIRADYVRTARAKGAKESTVIWKHALNNALLPVITVLGNNFGTLLGGAVVCETVFTIPGLGSYLVSAIRQKDVPVVTGCTLFIAAMFCVVVLLVDILYAFIDPRVKAKYSK